MKKSQIIEENEKQIESYWDEFDFTESDIWSFGDMRTSAKAFCRSSQNQLIEKLIAEVEGMIKLLSPGELQRTNTPAERKMAT